MVRGAGCGGAGGDAAGQRVPDRDAQARPGLRAGRSAGQAPPVHRGDDGGQPAGGGGAAQGRAAARRHSGAGGSGVGAAAGPACGARARREAGASGPWRTRGRRGWCSRTGTWPRSRGCRGPSGRGTEPGAPQAGEWAEIGNPGPERRCKNSSRATVERIGAVQTPVLRKGVVALLASASLLLSACSSGDGPAVGEGRLLAPGGRHVRSGLGESVGGPAAGQGLGRGGEDADGRSRVPLGPGGAARGRSAGRLARRGDDHPDRRGERQEDPAGLGARGRARR